jgi:hypothetical protein
MAAVPYLCLSEGGLTIPGLVRLGFVADGVTLGQVSLRQLLFSHLSVTFHHCSLSTDVIKSWQLTAMPSSMPRKLIQASYT